ncbi:acetylxylan esterase [Paenibacillus alkalitolerans]|uniref:acetylxylan esterase n=1 Tax=Paenibacillus alkalitolerans TaxID=2799335 RepID=UPI0018F6B8BE|nr:alpha/beta fold hydrolase [Paenibacillus alkalitolerans]
MNAIHKRIQDLHNYKPPLTLEPSEADRFWDETLAAFADKPMLDEMKKVESPLKEVEAYHVSYEGFDDTPVHAWYLVPAFLKQDRYPCIVIYQGYSGDKGLPERYAAWLLLGYAVFAVDMRGQGGETGNRLNYDFGASKGWITQNILHKERCYYMALTIDSIKAVDWVSRRPEILPDKIAVMGGSQGGGTALIASALNKKASLVIADIPNLCHMDFGVMHSTGSLTEAATYIKRHPDRLEAVLLTLAHFDIMNLAHRIQIPSRVSVALKDTVCWPETVFAAYNRIEGNKHIDIHPFSGHEVSEHQLRLHMQYLDEWKRS